MEIQTLFLYAFPIISLALGINTQMIEVIVPPFNFPSF